MKTILEVNVTSELHRGKRTFGIYLDNDGTYYVRGTDDELQPFTERDLRNERFAYLIAMQALGKLLMNIGDNGIEQYLREKGEL
jgi:hypothetical protein